MSIDWEAYEQRAADRLPYSGRIWLAERRQLEAYWAHMHKQAHPEPLPSPPEPYRAPRPPETQQELLLRLTKRERTLTQHIRRAWARAYKAHTLASRNPGNQELYEKATMLTGRAKVTQTEDSLELAEINHRIARTITPKEKSSKNLG